jgi:hypothetical protein
MNKVYKPVSLLHTVTVHYQPSPNIPPALSFTTDSHTDKKENNFFFISKEIQMGSVAKSYMRKGFL